MSATQEKIKILTLAFCDENNFNAQNLIAKNISLNLNPDLFDVTLFYTVKPDRRLMAHKNIHLIHIPSVHKMGDPMFLSLRQPEKVMPLFHILKHLTKRYDLLYHVRGLHGWLYLQLRKLVRDKKKTVYYVEGVVPDPFTTSFGNWKWKDTIKRSDYVYANSNFVSETVKKQWGIDAPVIYPGLDTNLFKPKIVENRKKTPLTVLYVGSFQERKRPYLVLEAAKRFPKVEFDLIGSGPLKDLLFHMKKKFGLNNVHIHGHVPLKELVSSMQEADVFLFPSIYEGFPKVTLEAAATGLPVIVFNNYRPESVIDRETGFIVGNVREMMEKLETLIVDDALRRKMGAKAREYAKKFDWNVLVKKWENEFEMIVSKAK